MSWYVLYTKSRAEKAVAARLEQSGIEVFCPLVKRRKIWSDRKKWVEEPLFSCYCFVNLEDHEREKALYVPGAVRFIFHCGKPAAIRDKDMQLLKEWLLTYDHEAIQATKLSPSDVVRVQTGALKEKSARVVEAYRHYVVLFLEDMDMQVRVDLRKNVLKKVS